MKPIVSSSRAVAALVIGSAVACACGSSQKELTAPQQAAANAEEQSQKAQADAQKARDEANKTQKDLAEAQQNHDEARQAEMAADQRAQAASRQAGIAEQQAGMAARPPPAAPPPEKGVAEAQGGPHAGHDSAGKVVVITASLLFKSGSAELLPSAKPKLDEVAQALQAQPEANNVKVEGYTDSTGTAAINDPLSQQRAQAVADYLQSKGVPQDRISAQGFGKQDPVSHAQTTEGRALNRRVDIVIEPVAGEPGKAPGQATPPAQPSPAEQQPSQHGQPSQPQP